LTLLWKGRQEKGKKKRKKKRKKGGERKGKVTVVRIPRSITYIKT